MPGAKPGERRGGRQLGTTNKANLEKNEALESALRLAFAKHGSAYIRTLTPAQFQFLAMHEAIEAGFIYSALAIADKVAPYYACVRQTRRSVHSHSDASAVPVPCHA
jgi:hypothetical protein